MPRSVNLCRDCRYFIVPEAERPRLIGRNNPDMRRWEEVPRCSWHTNPINGQIDERNAENERYLMEPYRCGPEGTHFEPATTMQGEP